MKIIVKTQFEDTHYWENAPEEVNFLRNEHRHIFFIEAMCEVTHDDRELEFIMVKHRLDEFIKNEIKSMPKTKSCEQMGLAIKDFLERKYERQFTIRVLEDNENGAEV